MQSACKMRLNRFVGKVFAVLFGLVLLIEVGCLPLFNSLAVKFEKSLVAELADKEDSEKTESVSETLIAILSASEKSLLSSVSMDLELEPFKYEKDNAQVHDHVFLEFRSIRI